MWIGKDNYERLVAERYDRIKWEAIAHNQEVTIATQDTTRDFLIKRVNQLEYIYSQLVAKEHEIPVVVPTIGTPESLQYETPTFLDAREVEQDAEVS